MQNDRKLSRKVMQRNSKSQWHEALHNSGTLPWAAVAKLGYLAMGDHCNTLAPYCGLSGCNTSLSQLTADIFGLHHSGTSLWIFVLQHTITLPWALGLQCSDILPWVLVLQHPSAGCGIKLRPELAAFDRLMPRMHATPCSSTSRCPCCYWLSQ